MNGEFFMNNASLGNKIGNYIVPGLDSIQINKVRMFHNKRHQSMLITPHSHRFDLFGYVMEGVVENTIYKPFIQSLDKGAPADDYAVSILEYGGAPGRYDKRLDGISPFFKEIRRHEKGEWYFMKFTDIHSIQFSKGAKVLIFEGEQKTKCTSILEPCEDGVQIETFKVEPWMFTKG